MRAVVLNGPNDFAPTDLPKPQIGDNDILLEMKKAGYLRNGHAYPCGNQDKGCSLSIRDRPMRCAASSVRLERTYLVLRQGTRLPLPM